jgi:hypothetical protein
VRRSPSGTQPPANGLRAQTVLLLLALAIVLAFAASAIFGLRRSTRVEPPAAMSNDSSVAARVSAARGRVEVLNGAGKPGLAKLATEKLRDAGFDVVQFGNARRSTDTSAVMDRVGNLEAATAIGRALGIANVKTVIDTTRFVDATVLIGKDWTRTPR